jgi:hypothetical protein
MYRLPEAGWWENYYVPMLARVADLRKTYGDDPTLAAILGFFELEVEMYRNHSRYHGYTFFVMQNELQVVNANAIEYVHHQGLTTILKYRHILPLYN